MFSDIYNKKRFIDICKILILIISLAACVPVCYSQTPPHPRLREKILSGEVRLPEMKLENNLTNSSALQKSIKVFHWQNSCAGSSAKEFNILVVFADFQDKEHSTPAGYFDSLLFSSSSLSLKSYFKEISCSKLNITTLNLPTGLGWIRVPENYSYYTSGGNYGRGSYPNNTQRLAEDIVKILDPYVDFSKYDNDKDGYVDGIIIVHSGKGAEYSGSKEDIWSYTSTMQPFASDDGVLIMKYSICPEYYLDKNGDMTIGTFAHELCHLYFGLQDLYDVDYSSKGLGKWSLMAHGCWNGKTTVGGDIPAYPDAYSRIHMGFVKVQPRTYNVKDLVVKPSENDSMQVYKVWSDELYSAKEYFLIENRSLRGFDQCLPGEGLLIYHIDENAGCNLSEWYPGHRSSGHYMVSLLQADNNWDLEQNANYGDAGDPFPGSKNNTDFSIFASPDSRSYSGKASPVRITNIRKSGENIIADINPMLNYQAALKIISPDKDERIRAGYNSSNIYIYHIKWTSENITRVTIQYSSNSGNSWNTIASNFDAANGGYWWTVPQICSDSCKVRILDQGNLSFYSESEIFEICDRPAYGKPADKWDLVFTQVITGLNEGFELYAINDISITDLKAANVDFKSGMSLSSDDLITDLGKINLDWYSVVPKGTYLRFIRSKTPGCDIDSTGKILNIFYALPASVAALDIKTLPLFIFRDVNKKPYIISGFDVTGAYSEKDAAFFNPNKSFPNNSSVTFNNYWFNENISDREDQVLNAIRMPDNWKSGTGSEFTDKAISISGWDNLSQELEGKYTNNSVKVMWSSFQEKYNKGWMIERKTKNTEWTAVGFTASKGDYSGTPRYYSFIDKNLPVPEVYYYRLRQISFDNRSQCSHNIKVEAPLPSLYSLEQNYPNPFNGSTALRFSLPAASMVSFTVSNSIGQIVKDNEIGLMPAGDKEIYIDLNRFSSGVYFFTLKASSVTGGQIFLKTKKMTLIK